MGECFLEVLRVHPSDDESLNSLLTLGICKALAITGCAEAWQVDSDNNIRPINHGPPISQN